MILKNHLKRVMPSLSSVVSVLVWFAIAPLVPAVVPAPDGGYPGFNTAEGQNALFNLTTGVGNTAVGWFSLWSDTDGSYNTAVGAGTLLFNWNKTGEGTQNTAVGTAALLTTQPASSIRPLERPHLSTTPKVTGNTAVGAGALYSNITGINNTAVGYHALFSNNGDPSFGEGSTTVHLEPMRSLTILLAITTALRYGALQFNTTGEANTATVIVRSEAIPPPASTQRLVFSALISNTTGGKTRQPDRPRL